MGVLKCAEIKIGPPGIKTEGSAGCLRKPVVDHPRDQIILTLDLQFKRLNRKRLMFTTDGQYWVFLDLPEFKGHIVSAIGEGYALREKLIGNMFRMK